MLSSPVYLESHPRPPVSRPRRASISFWFSQPSKLPTFKRSNDLRSNSLGISPSQPVTLLPTDRARKSFSCNTYGPPRKCCKQKTYGKANSFRCNTYKKTGGVGPPPFHVSTVPPEVRASPGHRSSAGGHVFHIRPSTSVPRRIESILCLESYCPLAPTRIHFLFN
jgi:hypothetical protein